MPKKKKKTYPECSLFSSSLLLGLLCKVRTLHGLLHSIKLSARLSQILCHFCWELFIASHLTHYRMQIPCDGNQALTSTTPCAALSISSAPGSWLLLTHLQASARLPSPRCNALFLRFFDNSFASSRSLQRLTSLKAF